jgi:hypothetical protein
MNHWIDVYREKTDEELLHIATSADLLPEAKDALQEALASRRLGEAEIAEYADDLNWNDVQQIIRRPDLSKLDLLSMLDRGMRLVVFQYCLSFIVFSVKRTSRAYLVAPGHSLVILGLRYTFVALVFGIWSIPHGVVWALSSAYKNFGGGIDVTPFIKKKLNVVR